MPDKDGNILPPIVEESFDGFKESKELKFEKCKHAMNFVNPTEIRCIKCGVGYTGTSREIDELYRLFSKEN